MKKKHISVLVVGIIILVGILIGVISITSKDDNVDKDYKVHDTDENTVEIESEKGLKESDSEDGPTLEENNIIDFNGGNFNSSEKNDQKDTTDEKDNKTDVTQNKDGDNEGSTEKPKEPEEPEDSEEPEKPEQPDENEIPDTGTWGAFY